MKRYGSRRNDNEYGDRAPVHGAKSSRARARRDPTLDWGETWGGRPMCTPRPVTREPDELYSGAIPDQEQE